jgi:hypothetical protein
MHLPAAITGVVAAEVNCDMVGLHAELGQGYSLDLLRQLDGSRRFHFAAVPPADLVLRCGAASEQLRPRPGHHYELGIAKSGSGDFEITSRRGDHDPIRRLPNPGPEPVKPVDGDDSAVEPQRPADGGSGKSPDGKNPERR